MVPLVIRGKLSGDIKAWDSHREREFTPGEIQMAQMFAAQAAVAIENARLFTQARTKQEEFQAVLESTSDAVIVTDPHGTIVLCNPAAEQTFDRAATQVVGKPLPEAVPAMAQLASGILNSAEAQTHHGEIMLAGQQTLACSIAPLRTADGAPRGWVSVLHDL